MDPVNFSAKKHLEDVILPWWETNGVDDVNGGVLTCFSNSGSLQSREKYTWSQGRWAWVCAEIASDALAGILDVDSATWSRRAIQTAEFIQTHSILEGGCTAFRTSESGRALPSGPNGELATSVFADLFAVLGFAGVVKLPSCPEPVKKIFTTSAEEILASSLARIKSRRALSAPYPVRTGFSDMAGPMTLLHAGSELATATGSEVGMEAAGYGLTELIGGDGKAPMWGERQWWEFRPDSGRNAGSLLARHKTPGHLLECVWMALHDQLVRGGPRGLPDWLPDLALRALELGWDEEYGGLFRYVDQDGGAPRGSIFGDDSYESLVQSTWDTKLWWVHVEAMYATALLAKHYGGYGFEEWNRKVAAYTLSTFPDPSGHEWTQIRGRSGAPLDMVVALPVKDPFHIARALIFLNRLEMDGDDSCTSKISR